MHNSTRRRFLRRLMLAPAALLLASATANAHNAAPAASAASSLSLSLPVAALVAAPALFLSAGAVLAVSAVEASATGTVWVLRRASDGVTASLEFSVEAVGASMVGVGTMISVTAMASGWLLSAAGEVLCIVPNALGETLFYSQRIR